MVRYGTNHHKSPLCGFNYTVYTEDLQEVFANFFRKKVPKFLAFSRVLGTFEQMFDSVFLSLSKMLFMGPPPPQDAVAESLRPAGRPCAGCTILSIKNLPFAQRQKGENRLPRRVAPRNDCTEIIPLHRRFCAAEGGSVPTGAIRSKGVPIRPGRMGNLRITRLELDISGQNLRFCRR